jgi:hypothetical protein
MKAKGMFMSALLIGDAFLVSYAIGFNSRHVQVVDPTMKPVAAAIETKPAPTAETKVTPKTVSKPASAKSGKHAKSAKTGEHKKKAHPKKKAE